ncbi:hypothetical protein BT96DRAFT_989175 [Gymnopus androsaceus JB14]|uniref:Transmembrane protein n=1 Tax=Gymnopus androsaceus JB14 TaxID=1447944 RepID=A0A6A4I7B3_9AGAR|nr:hypothetical protein BT96DRAFT_989175 [Gymnopus androsaceus JB14]
MYPHLHNQPQLQFTAENVDCDSSIEMQPVHEQSLDSFMPHPPDAPLDYPAYDLGGTLYTQPNPPHNTSSSFRDYTSLKLRNFTPSLSRRHRDEPTSIPPPATNPTPLTTSPERLWWELLTLVVFASLELGFDVYCFTQVRSGIQTIGAICAMLSRAIHIGIAVNVANPWQELQNQARHIRLLLYSLLCAVVSIIGLAFQVTASELQIPAWIIATILSGSLLLVSVFMSRTQWDLGWIAHCITVTANAAEGAEEPFPLQSGLTSRNHGATEATPSACLTNPSPAQGK